MNLNILELEKDCIHSSNWYRILSKDNPNLFQRTFVMPWHDGDERVVVHAEITKLDKYSETIRILDIEEVLWIDEESNLSLNLINNKITTKGMLTH